MRHINQYPAWPTGYHKKESGLGPLSGTLISQYDATDVITPDELAAGTVYGVPNFLWVYGDGATPRIDPTVGLNLAVAGVGVPVAGVTPWQYPDGTAEAAEEYNGTCYRIDNATVLAPPNPTTDDIVIAAKTIGPSIYPTANEAIISTRSGAGNGFSLYLANTNTRYAFASPVNSTGSAFAEQVAVQRGPTSVIAVIHRAGNSIRCWGNGLSAGAIGCVAGASLLGAGTGIGTTITPAATAGAGTSFAWIAVWWGNNIGATWNASSFAMVKQLSMESVGLRENVARKYWAYASTNPASDNARTSRMDRTGLWWLYSAQSPRAGDSNGVILEPERTLYTYKNYNMTATTGWSVTGGTLTSVTDTAEMTTRKVLAFGPSVLQFANASGADQYLYGGANAAAVAHCLSVFARYTAGAGARIGWRDSSSGAFTDLGAVSDNYARTVIENSTPPDTDCKFCIKVPNGTTIRCIMMQLERGTVVTSPKGNPNTATTEIAGGGITTMADTPVDLSGSLLTTIAPIGWSGATPSDSRVLSRVTAGTDLLTMLSAGAGGWSRSDGTVSISTGAPSAGVYVDVWSAWQNALQYIQQGLVGPPTTGAYDGTIGGAGALLAQSQVSPAYIKKVEIRSI